ncbi:MAG TPA: leucyl aminopeptidase [Actinomycetota bacterium]|nr:leucyl aminopeptidase [Actinomycetota bacterium]
MPTFSVSKSTAKAAKSDVLAVPVYEGLKLGPGAKDAQDALGSTLKELSEHIPILGKPSEQFTGELGDAILVQTLGKLPAKQVLFVGMGPEKEANVGTVRRAGAIAARCVGGGTSVATTIPQAAGAPAAAVRAFVEGFLLASYRYLRYRSEQDGRPNRVESVVLLPGKGWEPKAIKRAMDHAAAVAEGTNLARDLTNTPAGDKSPESLAQEARKIARNGLKVKVLNEKELAAKGFGGILGVGRGSPKPPRLIELIYEPPGAKRTIAFVGKGITFDSGGINLKPSDGGIDWMKMDMGGAGAVLGAMHAIAKLKPKVAVRAYVASSENMPDGNALHPGDVITQYGGKTVEIGNTDAEGRLVMADAIVYAKERGADVVVDIATLTGAMMIALGQKMFGVIGEPRTEVAKVLEAAERAGEPAWELPLNHEYLEVMKSDIADLRNVASRNVGGGAITAALFLKEFAGDTPWVHIDIAGPAKLDEDHYENPKWATGAGVRTLVEYALAQ